MNKQKNWVTLKQYQKLCDKTIRSLSKEKGYQEAIKLVKKIGGIDFTEPIDSLASITGVKLSDMLGKKQ